MTELDRKFMTRKARELNNAIAEYDAIGLWLVDAPFKQGEWDEKVERYNTISVKIDTLNGDKMRQ
jgi:hypothetical protein